jgi:hypothetical protein
VQSRQAEETLERKSHQSPHALTSGGTGLSLKKKKKKKKHGRYVGKKSHEFSFLQLDVRISTLLHRESKR